MSPQYIHRLESPPFKGKGFWHIRVILFFLGSFYDYFPINSHPYSCSWIENTAAQNEWAPALLSVYVLDCKGIAGLLGGKCRAQLQNQESPARKNLRHAFLTAAANSGRLRRRDGNHSDFS